VLETAHSIFAPWRSQVRTDALFTVINFVLSRFLEPCIALLRQTSQVLLSPGGGTHLEAARAFNVLVTLYYDLSCQDLPPAVEDSHMEFWAADGGLFLRFLAWDPPELQGDVCALVLYVFMDTDVLPYSPTITRPLYHLKSRLVSLRWLR
jgi:exportin-2 (importin alpha re-exporter)